MTPVGRPPKDRDARVTTRFPSTTIDRLDATLRPGESRNDAINTAVEDLIDRREDTTGPR